MKKLTDRKRMMVSRLLLAVFLPMLLLSVTHVHSLHSAVHAACDACEKHVLHIDQQSVDLSIHDCVLCQMAATPFVRGGAVTAVPVPTRLFAVLPAIECRLSALSVAVIKGRAPPFCFLKN